MTPIYKQKFFWVAVVSVLYLIIKYYKPDFPFTLDQLVSAVIFILALLGLEIEKALRIRGILPR